MSISYCPQQKQPLSIRKACCRKRLDKCPSASGRRRHHTKVHQLVTDLQQAVAKHDVPRRGRSRPLPHQSKTPRQPTYLKDAQAFIKNYDRIITPDIAAVIQNQKYEDLFVTYQGAMFGDGEVWITGFCTDNACKNPDIKIGTIQSNTNPRKSST